MATRAKEVEKAPEVFTIPATEVGKMAVQQACHSAYNGLIFALAYVMCVDPRVGFGEATPLELIDELGFDVASQPDAYFYDKTDNNRYAGVNNDSGKFETHEDDDPQGRIGLTKGQWDMVTGNAEKALANEAILRSLAEQGIKPMPGQKEKVYKSYVDYHQRRQDERNAQNGKVKPALVVKGENKQQSAFL